MFTVKSADLTNPTQKLIALFMVGLVLLLLWFLLPPLITIMANLYIALVLAAGLLFIGWNYEAFWSLFKRLSWNMTKKMISSDKLWYLWQGYNYLVRENETMEQDITKAAGLRIQAEKDLATIAKDATQAKKEAAIEKDTIKLRVLQVKVNVLDKQFKNSEPRLEMARKQEQDFIDYYNNRVADTEILKISLTAKAQEYEMYKKLSEMSDNASNWMKESPEMKNYNESIRQIDESVNQYTANIESFRRNVLPKMSSNSTAKMVDAEEGAKLIEEYKKTRLQLDTPNKVLL